MSPAIKTLILSLIFLIAQTSPSFAQNSLETELVLPTEVALGQEPVDFLNYQEIEHKGKLFHLALEEKDFENAKKLSPEEQERFFVKREKILAKFVSVLAVTKVFVGAGAVIKNKILFWKPDQRSLSEVYSESSHKVTEKVLTLLDKQLWETAKVVASSNETTFVFMPRPILGLGFRSKGFVPSLGLGFAFTINSERNEFVFEILSAPGRFQNTLGPIPTIGAKIMVITGLRFSNNLAGTTKRPESTLTFLPGPLIFSKSDKELAFYISPGVGLGLFILQTKIKEYKIFSFTQKLKAKASKAMPVCSRVHT